MLTHCRDIYCRVHSLCLPPPQAEKGETVIKRGGFAGQDSLEFTEAELLGWSNKRNDAKD